MDKTAVWNDFIDSLIEADFEAHKKTKEYEYYHNRVLHIDEMLTTNLTASEKVMVEEVLFEMGEAKEHRGEQLYQQGMRDCVMILKNLGVL